MKQYRFYLTGYEPKRLSEAERERLIMASDGLVRATCAVPVGQIFNTSLGPMRCVAHEHSGKMIVCEPASN